MGTVPGLPEAVGGQLARSWGGGVTGSGDGGGRRGLCFRGPNGAEAGGKNLTGPNSTSGKEAWPPHAPAGVVWRIMPTRGGISAGAISGVSPGLWQNSRFLGRWGPGGGGRRIWIPLLMDRGVELN